MDADDHLMVYYSGHGMKIEGDIGTFLMLRNGEEFDIGALTDRMNKSDAKHSVLILDTCRIIDNPSETAQLKSTSGDYEYSKRLSADNSQLARSMSVIYSASDNAPAHVALDGEHSAFTKHFANVLSGTRRPRGVEGAEISLLAAYIDVGKQLSEQGGAIVQDPDREVLKGQMDWVIARYRNR